MPLLITFCGYRSRAVAPEHFYSRLFRVTNRIVYLDWKAPDGSNVKRATLGVKMSRMRLRALRSVHPRVYYEVDMVQCLTLHGIKTHVVHRARFHPGDHVPLRSSPQSVIPLWTLLLFVSDLQKICATHAHSDCPLRLQG